MEGDLSFSVVSVVEEFLQQHGARLSEIDLETRKAEEAALRRYEAAGWLRRMVGVVGGKDLPAQPSEEEFRVGLRSGRILCNVLNKIQPGSVPKVVENPSDADLVPEGAALTAYQYFENIRNFLVTIQEMGVPNFEQSDLEQGGKSSRIVNCVLALKSYYEWKQAGGTGVWRFSGNLRPSNSKSFVRKTTSEPFTNSLTKHSSQNEKSPDDLGHDHSEMTTPSLLMLVRQFFSDKKPEEVPMLVESMLSKVMEEFECCIATQKELMKEIANNPPEPEKNPPESESNESVPEIASDEMKMESKNDVAQMNEEVESPQDNYSKDEESKARSLKQQHLFEIQKREIDELRRTLDTTKAGMQFMQTKYHEEFNNLGTYLSGLANAASRYHKVVEENRKLYNQVQDLKGSIRVYCRVRPFLPGQTTRSSTVDGIDEGKINIIIPQKYGKEGRKSFRFNKVFGPSATQADVFSDTRGMIRSVLDGYNVCIFAYGQTGSGKTHTMTGPKLLTEETRGVNYRALGDLFQLAEQRKDTILYEIYVQMLEIYNEQVRDLLSNDGNKRLEIRNTSQKGYNVPDANLVPVSSTSDVLELMEVGHRNRAVSSTALNDRSSRSHSCLTVHVQGRDLTTGATLRGCMHLVDLAGSERVDKSEVVGDRLKEAQHINKSLSALGDVIASLAHKNAHVPYRNSKLTQLLQDSLGGQAKTLMFVHISPEPDAIGETIGTLKFAERVATVELGAARVNKDGADVKELKEQIAILKEALARKDAEPESRQPSYSSSPETHHITKAGSSPALSNLLVIGNKVSGKSTCRQLVDEAGNTELRSKSGSWTNRLDFQEIITNSSPWPPTNRRLEKDDGSGDWVDKVIVKEDVLDGEEGQWGGEGRQLPQFFYQRSLSESYKVHPDQPYNKLVAGKMDNRLFDVASTDGSEENEVATSDSSEPDTHWQFSLPKVINGHASKTKKPQTKLSQSRDLSTLRRSSIPALIPPPTRRLSSGFAPPLSAPPLHKKTQPASLDGKRRTAFRK